MGHPMITYSFLPGPIYSAGNAAAGWAVVALLFGLLALV